MTKNILAAILILIAIALIAFLVWALIGYNRAESDMKKVMSVQTASVNC